MEGVQKIEQIKFDTYKAVCNNETLIKGSRMEHIASSEVFASFIRQSEAIREQAEKMQPGISIALPVDGFDFDTVRELAATLGDKAKAFAVFNHGTAIEFACVPKDFPKAAFAKLVSAKASKAADKQCGHQSDSDPADAVKAAVSVYTSCSDELLFSYSKTANAAELRKAGVVPYTFIQRKCAGLSSIRKSKMGPTNALREAVVKNVEIGLLSPLSKEDSVSLFGSTAELYRINVKESA